MDDIREETFVNRGDPIPVVPLDQDLSDDTDALHEPRRFWNMKENARKAKTSESSAGSYVQDRLLEK